MIQTAPLVAANLPFSPGESISPDHGNSGFSARPQACTSNSQMGSGPGDGGLGQQRGMVWILDALLVPRDARGIVLACGFVGASALGADALLLGDPIGFGYLVAAGVGYFFLQTRLVPSLLWLLIGAGGIAGATAGNSSDWVVGGLGLLLALVALFRPTQTLDAQTSGKVEESVSVARPSTHSDLNGSEVSSRNPEVALASLVSIRTIGRLRLEAGGEDLSDRLTDQPSLQFLFTYLLARTVGGRDSAIDRTSLADEVAPGISTSSQRGRLRNQLYKLLSALGPELKGLLRVNNVQISLDLSSVEVDFVELEQLSQLVKRRAGLIDQDLGDRVRDLLESTAGGEFLAGFSELEQQVTAGRGTASQVVEEARTAIADWRADLVLALAEFHEAAGRPQASIAFLQLALAQSPQRQDLARRLVSVYLQTGQSARASEVRLEYELTQEMR